MPKGLIKIQVGHKLRRILYASVEERNKTIQHWTKRGKSFAYNICPFIEEDAGYDMKGKNLVKFAPEPETPKKFERPKSVYNNIPIYEYK